MTNTSCPSARVIDAIDFAAHAHRAQRRKDVDATPYINHPIAVLRILACEAGIDDSDVLVAAALHDYLEDCCGHHQQHIEQGRATVRERFGAKVLDYVDALTDDKNLPKAERKRLQVIHAAAMPHGAKLVKLADKIANLRDIASHPPADWSLARRQEYYDWAVSVVDGLRGVHPQLEQLFDMELQRRPTRDEISRRQSQAFADNLNRNVLAEHEADLARLPPEIRAQKTPEEWLKMSTLEMMNLIQQHIHSKVM